MRTFIQMTSIVVTLWSAIFLAKGNLGLTPAQIAELSSTKYDFNPDLITSFARQRADTWVGVAFLLLAFGLQLAHEFWPADDTGRRRAGVLGAVTFSLAIFVAGWFWARASVTATERKVKQILDQLAEPSRTPPR